MPTDPITEQIPSLRRYARALTQDPDQADDLVQDCLERAWRRMHLWRPGTDLRAWLFTIMHNVYANQVRRYRSAPRFVTVEDLGDDAVAAGASDDALHVRDLGRALALLPELQREVLLLVALEAMHYEQVAEILGIPIGTVMSRLHRARERLRATVGDGHSPGLRRVK